MVKKEVLEFKWKISFNGREFQYAYNQKKDLLYCKPTPTINEINTFYRNHFNYDWYNQRKYLKRIQGWHRWRFIKKTLDLYSKNNKKILDIGCGHGWFVSAASKSKWLAHGLDFPSDATTFAKKKLNLHIFESPYNEVIISDNSYSTITLWHVLEHILSPSEILEKTKQWLNNDGLLIVAVPNLNSKGMKRKGLRWVWLQEPFCHIWQFSVNSLSDLLKENGYIILEIKTRDTWDAQFLYDGIYKEKIENYIVPNFSKFLSLFYFLFMNTEKRIKLKHKVSFFLIEITRILFYAYYLIFSLLKKEYQTGSELIIVAKVKK